MITLKSRNFWHTSFIKGSHFLKWSFSLGYPGKEQKPGFWDGNLVRPQLIPREINKHYNSNSSSSLNYKNSSLSSNYKIVVLVQIQKLKLNLNKSASRQNIKILCGRFW